MSRIPRTPEVAELVRRLSLTPHPEGGWYRETHRSEQLVHSSERGERAAFTSILFLLEAPQVSRFHRLDAEELWKQGLGSVCLPKREDFHRMQAHPGSEKHDNDRNRVAGTPADK